MMRQNGTTLQKIADKLNRVELEVALDNRETPPNRLRNASPISRELRRNLTKTGRYHPKSYHSFAMIRCERIVRNTVLKPVVIRQAIDLMKKKRWSHEQISGYLRLNGISISKERIYLEIRKRL